MKAKLFILGAIVFALIGFSSIGLADVHVGVNINLPPLVISGPPEVAVIPGTYVYFDPDVSVDLFFYDGYWYRDYEGYWYRCASYSGPWVFIDRGSVPDVFFHLPSDYRARIYGRIPYRELSRNWRTWHTNRYWNKVGWERGRGVGGEREHGVAPSFRGGERQHAVAPSVTGRERQHGVAPSFGAGQRQHGTAPSFGVTQRQHGVAPWFGGAQRQHGAAPSFTGGQRQNLGGNRAVGRQNMNRGGHARQR